jgi:hypothetical protein
MIDKEENQINLHNKGENAMRELRSVSAKAFVHLLIVVVIAIGLSDGVQEAAPGQTLIGEIILSPRADPGLAIYAHMDISNLKLEPNKVNEKTGSLQIKASGKWRLEIACDPATNGCMAEYVSVPSNGESIGFKNNGRKLHNSLRIEAKGYNEVDLAKGGVLIFDGAAGDDINIPLIFKQMATYEDEPLPAGHEYRIAISLIPSLIQ